MFAVCYLLFYVFFNNLYNSFSLLTVCSYVLSAPTKLLDTLPGILMLTDCLEACQANESCSAVNYETGLCVLFKTTADVLPGMYCIVCMCVCVYICKRVSGFAVRHKRCNVANVIILINMYHLHVAHSYVCMYVNMFIYLHACVHVVAA